MERPAALPTDFLDRAARLREQVDRVPGLVAAVLFGSFARGEATPWSDIDVAVLTEGELALDRRLDLMGDATAAFGRDADVVDLRHAPLVLRGRIVRDACPLVVRDRDAWNAFVTRATLDWLDYEPVYLAAIAIEVARLRAGVQP